MAQTQTTTTQTAIPNPANSDNTMTFDAQPVTSALTVNPQTTAPAPAPADNGMVFDSQPTATALTVPDPTSAATSTAPPSQPVTSLQHGLSVLNGETDPDGSWYPEVGSMMSGAVKSASNGLAGILDFINKPSPPQPIDPESIKATMAFYKRIHPSATQADAQAFVQKAIDSGKQPFSSTVQDVSNWLHSSGQPQGFWEGVGSLGEQALE